MRHSFHLKNLKAKTSTAIRFTCFFGKEGKSGKKFIYSTGESINPDPKAKEWNHNKEGVERARNKEVRTQLGRYSNAFEKIQALCYHTEEEFTSTVLREHFDKEFKKVRTKKKEFFDIYEEFIEEHVKRQEWRPATQKRYKNTRNLLMRFEEDREYPLTFNSINEKFYTEFTDYCLREKEHINNTFARNVGFLITFLKWAVEEKHTYNTAFEKFKRKQYVVTKQSVFKLEDIKVLMNLELKDNLERIRDIFVIQFLTSMRFNELSLINKNTVKNGYIQLKESKDSSKDERKIPLTSLAEFLIKKYDYDLPLLSNQKHNKYIKQIFEKAGYTDLVERNFTRGKEVVREDVPFFETISTHSARRAGITALKRNKVSDKTIAEITGQKAKTINIYYQVEDEEVVEAVKDTFEFDFKHLKKA